MNFSTVRFQNSAQLTNLVAMVGFTLFAILLAGCTSSGAPSCSDSYVKTLTTDVLNKELVSTSFKRRVLSRNGTRMGLTIASIPVETWKNDPPDPKSISSYQTFEISDIEKIISEAENEVKKMNAKLVGIRIENIDDEYKKAVCAAQVRFENGNELSISYTAQFTEDDDLHVEIENL